MAQVIKLKRSAVAGKTPQTSSLELGELGINTSDGKIYFHRSSSSDDSIQSVLTTDATITGSLKLSGSQHLSGSLNVMDDLTYGGNLTASLGSTSSFDRITSVGTSSIGYLIASGSNIVTTPDLTGSFASGSDVQQLLAESASYVVSTNTGSFLQNSDTASLGKVTLVSDITGSITSTASFGKLLGDASELSNLPESFTSAMISGSFQGGGSNLISGSILSTGSFGKLVVADLNYPINDGTDGQALITDGSGVLTFDDIKSVAIVKNISGTTLEKGTPVHATGSVGNTTTVIAASASDATTMPATFVLDEQLVDDEEGRAIGTGFVNGVNTVGFIEGGVVYVGEDGGYTQQKPTGTNLIQNIGIVTKVDANGSGFIYGSGRSNDVPNLLDNTIFYGSGSNQMQQIHISGALQDTTLGYAIFNDRVEASSFTGSLLSTNGVLSSSAQIASDISGSFVEASASFSTRITTEETNVDNLQTDSGSFSTRITTNETNITNLQTDSGSFSTRITTAETELTNLQTDSGSFSTRVTTLENQDVDDDLTIAGDTGGNLTIDLDSETLTLAGGTGVATAGSSNTITFNSVDSEIVHDNLSGFVSNEHIDHSSVSITAGNGLTGGGTITSTRTINVGAGDGISVVADSVAVDTTVLRTTGDNVVSSSTQIASDISGSFTAGTGLDLSSGEFSVDVSDFMSNGVDNRVLTATGTDAINAESGLTYDGSNLDITGNARATGDVIAFYSSDKRLKDNIIQISNPIEKIKSIGGYEFDWNDNQSTYEGHDIGVIAQEIEEVLPELVTTRDTGYKAVKYEKIIALLIEGIKEQQKQIDEIKNKL